MKSHKETWFFNEEKEEVDKESPDKFYRMERWRGIHPLADPKGSLRRNIWLLYNVSTGGEIPIGIIVFSFETSASLFLFLLETA